jgi:calpain-15
MTGLRDEHAYTILDVIETYDNSNRKRLVQLRNPWGYFEWKGAHSDGCQSWTDNLKHMLALREENGDFVSPTNY